MSKISVCMATYNGGKYIHDQLASILGQLKDDDEVIISDDSSTDSTLEIIRSFNDKRIKIFDQQKFRNAIFNFENALKHATGDIIFLSDQDDIWDDKKVAQMSTALSKADLVVCDCKIIDDDRNVVTASFFKTRNSSKGVFKNLVKNSYLGCCIAFKKEVLKKALPFPKKIPMHDIWLGFVAELYFKPVFLDEVLTHYRKHNNNVSPTTALFSQNNWRNRLSYRVNILRYLFILFVR